MAGAWLHNCVSLAPEKRARKAQCTCLCCLTWSRELPDSLAADGHDVRPRPRAHAPAVIPVVATKECIAYNVYVDSLRPPVTTSP
jgi:hypothetical protein